MTIEWGKDTSPKRTSTSYAHDSPITIDSIKQLVSPSRENGDV